MSQNTDKLNGLMARTGKQGGHNWVSRDYEHIHCLATGCQFNVDEWCAVPSRCKIGPNGSCEGFSAKKDTGKKDGD